MRKYSPAQLQGFQRRAYHAGVRAWRNADDDAKSLARVWYAQAQDIATDCGTIAGFTGDEAKVRGAVALAVLSPQTRWHQNVRAAYALASGNVEYAYSQVINRFVDKARKAFDPALSIAEVWALATGPKVSEFARACYGDRDACVWDVWMLRAVRMESKALEIAGVKDALTKGLSKAATEMGTDNATLQALVWGAVRGSME